MNSPLYVSLGTRCNSSFILRDRLKLQQVALPFDWLDISPSVIEKFLSVPVDELRSYMIDYLNLVDPVTFRHGYDNTWFIHFMNEEAGGSKDVVAVAEKLTRRLQRLHEMFASGKDIIFLSVFAHHSPAVTMQQDNLMDKVSSLTMGTCLFVTVNCSPHEINRVVEPTKDHPPYKFINLSLQLEHVGGWKEFDVYLEKMLNTHEWTKQFFPLKMDENTDGRV